MYRITSNSGYKTRYITQSTEALIRCALVNIITSDLSLAFSIRSCCSSVVKVASLLVVALPQLGQQDLLICSLIALFSSRSFSISPFNNEFSWRSCIAYKHRYYIFSTVFTIRRKTKRIETENYLDLGTAILEPKLDLPWSKA